MLLLLGCDLFFGGGYFEETCESDETNCVTALDDGTYTFTHEDGRWIVDVAGDEVVVQGPEGRVTTAFLVTDREVVNFW